MLEIQGNLSGEEFSKPTVISAKRFVELYGGDVPKLDPDGTYIIKLNDDKIVRVPGELGERVPSSYSFKSYYQASLPDGSSFTLRYYTNKTDRENGSAVYGPDNLSFSGRYMAFTASDYEKFVFYATCSSCKNSRNAAANTHFYVFDPLAVQRQAEQDAKRIEQMLESVMRAPDHIILAKSAAMVVANKTTGVPLSSPVSVHKTALQRLLFENVNQFYNSWYSDSSMVSGLLRLAIDRGVFEQGTQNGRPVWQTKDKTIVTFFDAREEPLGALERYANSSENREAVLQTIAQGLNVNVKETVDTGSEPEGAPVPPAAGVSQPNEFQAIVSRLKASGVVYSDGGVVMLSIEGQEPEVLLTASDKRKWQTELAETIAIDGAMYARLNKI